MDDLWTVVADARARVAEAEACVLFDEPDDIGEVLAGLAPDMLLMVARRYVRLCAYARLAAHRGDLDAARECALAALRRERGRAADLAGDLPDFMPAEWAEKGHP